MDQGLVNWHDGPPGWVWPALSSMIVAMLWVVGGFVTGPLGAQATSFWTQGGGLIVAWMGTTMGLWLGYKGVKAVAAMQAVGGVKEAEAEARGENAAGVYESDPTDEIIGAGQAASKEG